MISLSHSFLSLLALFFSSFHSCSLSKNLFSPMLPLPYIFTLAILFLTFLIYTFLLSFFIISTSLCLSNLLLPPPSSPRLSPSVPPFHHADSGRSGAEGEGGRHRDQRSPELPHRPGCRCQEPQGALIKNSPQLLVASPSPPLLPSPAHSCTRYH